MSVRDDEATEVRATTSLDEWDRAVRAHSRRVIVSLLAMGLSLEDARETANRAWARIFEQERAGNLQHVALPALVIRQARFYALDVRRSSALEQRRHMSAVDTPDPRADPEQTLLTREQLARAATAIAEFNSKSQEVFFVVYQNPALSHAEVAESVGLSVQRVRQILWEVRRRVRDVVEAQS